MERERVTTLSIRQSTKDSLNKLKVHPRETWDEMLCRIVKEVEGEKE